MSGRILVANEVATNRIHLRACLNAASYAVTEARSWEEAWNKLSTSPHDMIIIDSSIGGPGCHELCREIKSHDRTCNAMIVVLCDAFDSQHRLRALQAGADEVLPREVREDELRARVRNLLRIRTLAEELAQRQSTAVELGFAEPGAVFERNHRVMVVNGQTAIVRASRLELKNCQFETVALAELLPRISGERAAPDLVILPPETASDQTALTLIAELRSRPATRHCAIMLTHHGGDRDRAAVALDLGANDLIETDSTVAELRYRIVAQLNQKQKSDRLRNVLESGMRMAVTDPLTGLFNRRYAMPHLARVAARAGKTGAPFAVLVLDIDRFKRINDEYGHGAGDRVLVTVADRLKSNLRGMDMVARIGGEEFMIALPDTDLKSACAAAERLRRLIGDRAVEVPGIPVPIAVTVSIGVAVAQDEEIEQVSIEEMVDCADQALLSAKSSGRNLVDYGRNAA